MPGLAGQEGIPASSPGLISLVFCCFLALVYLALSMEPGASGVLGIRFNLRYSPNCFILFISKSQGSKVASGVPWMVFIPSSPASRSLYLFAVCASAQPGSPSLGVGDSDKQLEAVIQ